MNPLFELDAPSPNNALSARPLPLPHRPHAKAMNQTTSRSDQIGQQVARVENLGDGPLRQCGEHERR